MFIVIEGLDGAGKSTQVKRIREELSRRGVESEYLHFPRFDAPVYGDLIARFLRGDLGPVEAVNPYVVALLYAGDRKEASPFIENWLKEGKCVIADRYVYSNIAYQCAKVSDEENRGKLREWILSLEYGHNKIIKPDLTLFLNVPFGFTVKKLTEVREGEDREYLCGKKDIHEASLSLQEKVRDVYLLQEEKDPDFRVVECGGQNAEMLSADEIFSRIYNEIWENRKF